MKTLALFATAALLAQESVLLPYYPNDEWPPMDSGLVVTNYFTSTNYIIEGNRFDAAWPSAEQFVGQMKAYGELTNVVNLLATNGTFCSVRGHVWLHEFSVFAVYDPSVVGRRRCGVCNLYQEQRATEWK